VSNHPHKSKVRQARWDEPLLFERTNPGVIAHQFPTPEEGVRKQVGKLADVIPKSMRRKNPPKIPEVSEPGS